MNNIIEEFKNIFKYETIIKVDDMKYLNNEYINYVQKHKDILFIINCEYEASSIKGRISIKLPHTILGE